MKPTTKETIKTLKLTVVACIVPVAIDGYGVFAASPNALKGQ